MNRKIMSQWISLPLIAKLCERITPYLFCMMLSVMTIGLLWGLFYAPADYQQGDAFRIIYVHVPSAFLSLMVYSCMAMSAAVFLIWRIKVADEIARASAPVGALFTFLALITGSI
ncbi:MAG TPA: cytochrome c biogenesis protein, partial [Gammaproteobacteria bacterium]|nr:cytochrome c biogenesis protein [Gammaproteobacteria bacterium]